jgi:5-methylcytosine-specific restriction protein A
MGKPAARAARDRRYDSSSKRRDDPDRRFRDSRAWRDHLRPQQLQREPLCQDCAVLGFIMPANEVDHVQEPRGDFRLQRDPANFRSLCKPCHGVKTRGKPVKGCLPDGTPADPRHHWNSGKVRRVVGGGYR